MKMKIFSNLNRNALSPDMKDSGIDQDVRTNRTQPKNTPTPPLPVLSSDEEELDDLSLESNDSLTAARLQRVARSFKHNAQGGFILQRTNRSLAATVQPQDKRNAIISFNSNDWIFLQATIVSSVNVEDDGYTVTPDSAPFINDNANSWDSKTLQKWYKSFIGAHNYKDHDQDRSRSKGIILDAVLRRIPIEGSKTGESVLYVDILVAVNKNIDPEWAQLIDSGRVKWLSMGAISSALKCTRCGCISFDEDDDCEHMLFELGMNYFDENGIKRPIAALITDDDYLDQPDSGYMVFKEASLLSVDPAFTGACTSHRIEVAPDQQIDFIVPRKALQRDAFQFWGVDQGQIKGVPRLAIVEDENVRPDMYQ